MNDDLMLLREFAASNSEAAFAALVARHMDLVHSVAVRQVRDPHLAEEITQAVFILLARKAQAIPVNAVLAGWLCRTARYVGAEALRQQRRQQQREQEAYMQSVLNEPETELWTQIAPLLDGAMATLGRRDHDALVLRFFENKNFADVGAALGTGEDTARMRVHRALEKLRKFFTKRGVRSTTVLLAGAISAHSVQAAPAGLAVSITAAAKGAALSASSATLVNGTLKIMTYTKLKLAAGVTLGILLAAGTTTLVLSPVGLGILRTPQTIARQTRTTYAALSSYSDTGTVVWEGGGDHSQTVFTTRLARPSLYRIDWTQTGPNSTENGIVWSQGNGDFMARGAGGLEKTAEPDKMRDAKQALAMSAAASGRGVSVIPEAFFNPPGSDTLEIAASGRLPLTLERAEKVGGVDCFVLSSVLDASKLPGFGKLPADAGRLGSTTTTLWIGKRDHLIHQIRTATKGMTFTLPRQSDDNIRTILERQNKAATPEAIAAWRTQMEAAMNQARGATLVFTETHDHIAINPKLSAADFAR